MPNDNMMYMEETLDNFASEKNNVIANNLLGSYDKKGNYYLSEPIKQELLKLTKYKKRNFNNSIFCVSYKPGFGEYAFKIDYEKNSTDNVAKATIYLVEKIYKVNGYVQDTICTPISEFVGPIDGFIENSYTAFNVSTKWADEDGDDVKERLPEEEIDNEYLEAKNKFNEFLDEYTKNKLNKLYEDYFTEKLRALNALSSPFAKKVLEDFRTEYAKVEKFFLTEKDYKALNELLDVCVVRNKLSRTPSTPEEVAQEAQEQEYFKNIEKATEEFVKETDKVREKAFEKSVNKLNIVEKERVEEMAKQPATSVKKDNVQEPTSKPANNQRTNDNTSSSGSSSKRDNAQPSSTSAGRESEYESPTNIFDYVRREVNVAQEQEEIQEDLVLDQHKNDGQITQEQRVAQEDAGLNNPDEAEVYEETREEIVDTNGDTSEHSTDEEEIPTDEEEISTRG